MRPETTGETRRAEDDVAPSEVARDPIRRRDEFLGLLSQEFRNPLAAIQTAAEVLRRDDVEAAVRRQAGGIVDRQLAHLRRLLDEILDMSRASLGRLTIRRDRVDVVQVLRDAALAAAPQIDRGRHVLQVDLPAEPIWVIGDGPRLFQVFSKLIENAIRDARQGTIVSIAAWCRGGEVGVEVRDAWQSLDAAALAALFEPFACAEVDAGRPQGGVGLGLSLARSLVELHGGVIRAALAEGAVGLQVGVRLPALSLRRDADAPARQPTQRLRVLVIEDNDDARQMLAEVLRIEGHEVREASDGATGLAALLEMSPDVALIDIGLPNVDGYEVARKTRLDPRGQQVLLVAVTGYGMPKDVDRGWDAGFDHYLVKPVQFAQLSELFETLRDEVARGGARR